ncbi:NADH dehydrogenase [ubiquinone] 1 alpha subcomplex assembly factor 4 [Brienomyrus brachyistius]|uniref:NADH dehydrogenase [ubiquinone] 1 alpha subcomplex assembly factor 4 n=1 Tax=Brienomyrus brachyistius TaxID=42636 RepID=UPI0020B201FD|nr:NADH dehydrogenase [ubiquinone] 1 alpha subcomplex assembly factor 4 [Brienomyrus brachyistius]
MVTIKIHGGGLNLTKEIMGSRITRVFRNFNLENRVHREIGKVKPLAAPRHSSFKNNETSEFSDSIHKKNDPLLNLLKSVYVESREPPVQDLRPNRMDAEVRRPLKFSLPGDPYGFMTDVKDVPKGKLSIVEALNVLNQHKNSPKTWTPEKLAQEYSLDLKDTKGLLEFFVPFDVKIIPPKSEGMTRIKEG